MSYFGQFDLILRSKAERERTHARRQRSTEQRMHRIGSETHPTAPSLAISAEALETELWRIRSDDDLRQRRQRTICLIVGAVGVVLLVGLSLLYFL